MEQEAIRAKAAALEREQEHSAAVSKLHSEFAEKLGSTEGEWAEKLAERERDTVALIMKERRKSEYVQAQKEAESNPAVFAELSDGIGCLPA